MTYKKTPFIFSSKGTSIFLNMLPDWFPYIIKEWGAAPNEVKSRNGGNEPYIDFPIPIKVPHHGGEYTFNMYIKYEYNTRKERQEELRKAIQQLQKQEEEKEMNEVCGQVEPEVKECKKVITKLNIRVFNSGNFKTYKEFTCVFCEFDKKTAWLTGFNRSKVMIFQVPTIFGFEVV